MKRLVIMVCYSITGEIEGYKRKIIDSVNTYADSFIVVINGNISKESYSFLKSRSLKILLRENIGYDAGAYKDAISHLDLNFYDELLLMNDTFYGFFYSLEEFFCKTTIMEEVDFWGLTKHPEGIFDNDHIGEHIQAYFILIKSRMLHSNIFRSFWNNLEYPRSYCEAVKNFEIYFTVFFQKYGFKGEAYCNLNVVGIEKKFNENPYLEYPYELIMKLRYPILKRKSCYIGDSSVWKAIGYIKEKNLYDIDFIFTQMLSDYKTGAIYSYFNLYELELFLDKYKKIYIFGKGIYGLSMYEYLCVRQINVEKFIVSQNNDENNADEILLSDIPKKKDFGIIVALKPQYVKEIIEKLLDKVTREQLFLGNNGERF